MLPARRRFWRWALLVFWVVLLAASLIAYLRSGVPMKEVPGFLRDEILRFGAWGPVIYILVYILRPLTILPAVLFNVTAGLVWGPVGGVLYTLLGENLSAALAFYMGRWLGRDWLSGAEIHWWTKIEAFLRGREFMSVLVMRLIYVPFDVVNFGCGLTRMPYPVFGMGTFLGTIPSIITFVYFGDGWFHPRSLMISGAVFLLSLGVAHLVKSSKIAKAMLSSGENGGDNPVR